VQYGFAYCTLRSTHPSIARDNAARASSRVESSVGSGELTSLMIKGISVQPSYLSLVTEAAEDRMGFIIAVLDLQARMVRAA